MGLKKKKIERKNESKIAKVRIHTIKKSEVNLQWKLDANNIYIKWMYC